MTEKQKVLFIINPVSGVRHKKLDVFRKLIGDSLDHNRFDEEFITTAYQGHATEITKEAYDSGIRTFVVAGGDGSVNEVGAVLAGTDATLGIIPEGSGNGLAHHLNIPGKTAESISVLNRFKTVKIDTCMVNEVFFASIAGIGFDARVARQFAKSKHRGFITYARIVLKEYFTYKPGKYTLKLDGKELKTRAFFISFANSNQFGYNTRIAPNASLTDGMIDVCIVRKPPLFAIPLLAHLVFRKRVDRSKYMDLRRAAEIIIKRKKGKTVNVDGEPVKMQKELNISIRPASLNVLVP